MRTLIMTLAVAGLCALPSAGSAKTISYTEATQALIAACGADIGANCKGVKPGGNRLQACLLASGGVSPQCKQTYDGVFASLAARAKAQAAALKHCESDAERYCSNFRAGNARILRCLTRKDNVRKVSKKCNQAITDAGWREATTGGPGTLSEGDILQSLVGAGGAAASANYNVEAIKQNIAERIRVEGTENAASPPPVLQALAGLPNLTVEVQFDFDSDWILPESWVNVARMADALHNPILLTDGFLVVGHTDAKGSRQYNLDLSDRRALSVREMLTTTYGVDPGMLAAAGFGEEQLRDPQNPDSGANRRVQLLNIGPR